MSSSLPAAEMLDREFLGIRRRVLDIAASLDRIERCPDASAVASDQRVVRLREAMRMLADGQGDLAQRVQVMFSDPCDADFCPT